MSFFRVTICAAVLTALAGIATAQDYRGRVSGIVVDSSQAAIPGATVGLKNVATGVDSVKTTDATGQYIFDFVAPGIYTLTAEATGFNRSILEKIEVLTRGDVTVNVTLQVGAVTEAVTVSSTATELQFTTSTMSTTVVGTMLKELPVLARNPFTLAMLNPAVVNDYWDAEHRNPFYMWSSNGLNVGGDTAGHNDLLLDGVPLGVASRGSYSPPMDAVQEVAVQQNSVDAQFGFSGGGTLSLSMKSGTNEWHGTAYYFGRNPALNATANRTNRSPNPIRNHIWGGTLGNPIKKNKLFTFNTWEQWKTTQPSGATQTLPTDAERTGDFSGALTPEGNRRIIYDPFSTKFDPITQQVIRTPFAGNIIPGDRINPVGQRIVNDLWKPNNPGDDPTGVNNFRSTYAWWVKYWNFSNRTDYNINDKWKLYTRFSKFQTRLDNPNYGGTIAVPSDNGGLMDALNAAADVLYQISPRTVLNVRYGATYEEDSYNSTWAQVKPQTWADIWKGSDWYKSVLAPLGSAIYYPNFNFSGVGYVGTGYNGWWLTAQRKHSYEINLSHDRGMHHLKVGQTLRYAYETTQYPAPAYFNFYAGDTANTFLNPNLTQTGDPFAAALLGGMNDGGASISAPERGLMKQWAAYVQDDLKVSRNVTLNLGLRWEYETPIVTDNNIISRYLDLQNPIPEMQANPPSIPSDIASQVPGGYKFNGAWVFADNSHPGLYNANRHVFEPRVGLALRLNDKTAVRVGYARYIVPAQQLHPEGAYLPIYGYNRSTGITPQLQGVPQATIDNPFPASNPVQPVVGNSLGRYQNLGDSASWWYQDLNPPANDRFNFSVQRELPQSIKLDATVFMNFGRRIVPTGAGSFRGWSTQYGNNFNQIDPNLVYTLKGQMDQSVPNPFYNYLTPDKFPGSLRYQENIAQSQLLRPYPQYGNLTEQITPGFNSHYRALQIKAERSFKSGLSFSFGYNLSSSESQNWFNGDAQYADMIQSTPGHAVVSHASWMPDTWPRHRFNIAGTWDLPIGKGRAIGSNLHPVLLAIVGGWSTSHLLMWNSGNVMDFRFQQLNAPSSTPAVYRDNGKWFDTSGFSLPEPYTERTNPWRYSGLTGPRFWNLDSTLVKYFPIKERMKFELRLEAYNAPNVFIPTDPVMSVNSPSFGKTTNERNYGRQVQYTARLHF